MLWNLEYPLLDRISPLYWVRFHITSFYFINRFISISIQKYFYFLWDVSKLNSEKMSFGLPCISHHAVLTLSVHIFILIVKFSKFWSVTIPFALKLLRISASFQYFLCVLFVVLLQGHVKVVQYLVKEVNQFPSDIECMRYIATITDKVGLICCWSISILYGIIYQSIC